MLVVYGALLVTSMQAATWYKAMLFQLSHWGAACLVHSLVIIPGVNMPHMSTFLITMPYLGLFLDGAVFSRAVFVSMNSDLWTSPLAFDKTAQTYSSLHTLPRPCSCAEEAAWRCMQCNPDINKSQESWKFSGEMYTHRIMWKVLADTSGESPRDDPSML